MKKYLFYIISLILTITFVSCNKSEGEGGKGSITGKVYKIIDDGTIIAVADGSYAFSQDTIVAVDEDVYILYGSNETGYNDKTKTSFNGTFEFPYLREGNYTVFAYTDLASDEKEAVMRKVNVDDDNMSKVDDIYIYDGKNVGRCGVVGKIAALWKDATSLQPGVGLRVYIRKVGTTDVSDTRADDNGMFSFSKLDPNAQYVVYAETEPAKNEGILAESQTITTGKAGSVVTAEDLNVFIY